MITPTDSERPSMLVDGMMRSYATDSDYVVERYENGKWTEVARTKLENEQ